MGIENSKNEESSKSQGPSYQGKTISKRYQAGGHDFEYDLQADWMTLQKDEKPAAKMFYFAYTQKTDKPRPVCFAFNGGPGASSVYLHLGALGPQRVDFSDDGSLKSPPFQLIDNPESWLPFTDLVFIDPVGTGFSRVVDEDKPAGKDEKKTDKSKVAKDEYFKQNKDLESISEFIEKFLSQSQRWNSPIYLAGESYGGYRVAKLARMAQEKYGISLNGIFAISPAFEFNLLNYSDTNVLPWLDVLPSLVASSIHHKRSSINCELSEIESQLKSVEEFALGPYLQSLVIGEAYPEKEAVIEKLSEYTGLPLEYVKKKRGRLNFVDFARQLLKDQDKVLGVYDGSTTGHDPFPDRDMHMAPDPSLAGIEGMFRSGIQSLINETLGTYLDQSYRLLSMEVNESWSSDEKKHYFDLNIGATEDLRFALSLNPNLKFYVLHGLYDLVTPYYSSQRLLNQVPLNPELRSQIEFKNFLGGHMFYSWKESREQFTELAARAINHKNES